MRHALTMQTDFVVGKASSMKLSPTSRSASEIIASSRRHTPNQRRTFGGIRRLFSSAPKTKGHSAYRPTVPKIEEGPACRIYGSVKVKKVTANLHVTTLGHGYMSFEHTDHHRESTRTTAASKRFTASYADLSCLCRPY
jgi:hypothetical protein